MQIKTLFSLAFISLLTTGCLSSSDFSWNSYKNDDVAINLKSSKYVNYDASFDTESFENSCNNLTIYAEEQDINQYDANLRYVDDKIYELYSCLDIVDARYYEDKNDKESKALYDKYYELTRLYSEKRFTSSELIYKSGNRDFIRYYFGNMTNEEIEQYLSERRYDEKISAWEKTISDLQNDISEATNEFEQSKITLNEYNEIYYDDYYKIICNGNELAKYKGYSNYLEYLYKDSYGRDYSYEDSLIYAENVKDYLLPLYSATTNKVLDDASFTTYLNNYNLANRYFDFTTYFDNLASYMGGDYFNNYQKVWGDGYYTFSSNDNSLGTAYTIWLPKEDEYLLFFSKKYQSILTVCHEFGHVNAFMSNDYNGSYSMDIKETHSSTNEYLYLTYTLMNLPVTDVHYNDLKNTILNNIRYDLFSECGPAIAAEIEYFVYSDTSLTKEKMIQYITDVRSGYPSINPAYVAYSTAISPGYYISYGTSGIATLQFFTMLYSDFKTGAENYKNFVAYKGKDTKTTSIWKSVGINSPFDEQTYIDLVNKLGEYLR